MQPHQQTFRILSIVFFGLISLWNLMVTTGAVLSRAWGHTPAILWYALAVWAVAFVCAFIFSTSTVRIGYGTKAVVMAVAIAVSLLPTVIPLFSRPINEYVLSWESKHCKVSDEKVSPSFSVPDFIYLCDNGDKVWVYEENGNVTRLWESGVSNAHYPYSLFF